MSLYTATVESLNRGWDYTAVEGVDSDPTEPVHLASPLTYEWDLQGGIAPSHLEPTKAVVNFAAKVAQNLPRVEQGDLIKLRVRHSTAGPYIIDPPPMRVTAVDVELVPGEHQTFKARLKVELVDLLADLAALYPTTATQMVGDGLSYDAPAYHFRPFIAEVARTVNRTIGVPTGWSDTEGYDSAPPLNLDPGNEFTQSALEELHKWLRSYAPADAFHTLTPAYLTSHPSGFEQAGPPAGSGNWGTFETQSSDAAVATAERYYVVPASRKATGNGLPLALAVVGGKLTLAPVAVTPDGHSRVAVDAGFCRIPAIARRAREHLVNVVRFKGTAMIKEAGASSYTPQDHERDYTVDLAGVLKNGTVVREVETYLRLGYFPPSTPGWDNPPEPGTLAPHYAGTPTADAWSFDKFEVVSSAIPEADAATLLPKLAPRFLGETDGDNQVLRHVVLYNLDASASLGSGIAGFVVGGSLSIQGGDIIWQLSLTPGAPVWAGSAPIPATYGDLMALLDSTNLTALDIDPGLMNVDFAYVQGTADVPVPDTVTTNV